MNTQNGHRDYGNGGVAFIGSILAAVGLAWMLRPEFIVQGAVLGCGVGFVLMALLSRKG